MGDQPEGGAVPAAGAQGPATAQRSIASNQRVLGLRVASSVVLLPLGLAAIVYGNIYLAAAASLVGLLMAYEWARMQNPKKLMPDMIILAMAAVSCPILAHYGQLQAMWPTVLLCGIIAAGLRSSMGGRLESFCGALYIAAPGALFVLIRNRETDGMALAVLIAVTIWATDIAAYFTGRAIGGPRLLPTTSPHKTWAGFIGGAVFGAAAAAVFAFYAGGDWMIWALLGVFISIIGQGGDMFESLVKRHFKVKDTSGVIPGHGGVMDRLDGLMAATIVCSLFLTIFPDAWPQLKDSALHELWR